MRSPRLLPDNCHFSPHRVSFPLVRPPVPTMAMLDRLEKKFGRYAVSNLTLLLIYGQIIVYVLAQFKPELLELIDLVPGLVLQGEVWRLITFIFWPPLSSVSLVFVALAWYFFYLMGTALEGHWGDFRYMVFLLVGWFATVAFALLAPLFLPGYEQVGYTNAYLGGSVFLAFAYLNPEFVILLFFILPVKIKWLAWLTWAATLHPAVRPAGRLPCSPQSATCCCSSSAATYSG